MIIFTFYFVVQGSNYSLLWTLVYCITLSFINHWEVEEASQRQVNSCTQACTIDYKYFLLHFLIFFTDDSTGRVY